jgi:hypothetical protein
MRKLFFGSAILAACTATAEEKSTAANTNVAPRAAEVLRDACKYLAEAPYFCLNAEIWREHVNESGQKLQFTRLITMEVKRPGQLHVEINAPYAPRAFWFDGKSMSILDRKRNLFSITAMPGNIDSALDRAHDEFGIDLPLIDLAVSAPYGSAMARVQTAQYLGVSSAMGFNCHHLAFTQENVDWQVWIDDGPQPLIRKFVITHKNEPGAPEFTALIRSWNLTDRIADSDFAFMPPAGAMSIPLRPDGAVIDQAGGSAAHPHTPTGR